jgi:hypothetical protein
LDLSLHGERLDVTGGPAPLRLFTGDTFEASSGVVFRVVGADASASCGWPPDVAAPLTVPTDEGLRVFGDQLLERGYPVGQRFTSRDPAEDQKWLGAIPLEAVTAWRVGVVDALRLAQTPASPWALVKALRRTAITRCLRRLTLGPMPYEDTLVRILEALVAQGGLPWLQQLDVISADSPPAASSRKSELEALVARVSALHPALLQRPSLTSLQSADL